MIVHWKRFLSLIWDDFQDIKILSIALLCNAIYFMVLCAVGDWLAPNSFTAQCLILLALDSIFFGRIPEIVGYFMAKWGMAKYD